MAEAPRAGRKEGPPREIACPLCGARDTRRLFTKFELGIERCRRCRLVYANPRAPEDVILARYSSHYFWHEYLPNAGAPGGVIDDVLLDGRHGSMLALIRSTAPDATRLLEIGSGAGLFLRAASRAGWAVAGLELSEEGAAFARDRLGLDVRTERAEAMSFEPASFDVAVMFDVIEHLFEPRGVLEATRRALRPGGILVVSTPNLQALSRYALGKNWAVLSPLEHTCYFEENTLERMLTACGFTILQSRPVLDMMPEYLMNADYTHAPAGRRAELYRKFVRRYGWRLRDWVQRAGRADALVAVARANESDSIHDQAT